VDPQKHRLMLHGMVDRPLTFTMEEIRRFPSVSRIAFLECNANSRPLRGPNRESVQLIHGRTSCSEWTGVLLPVLLKECGVQSKASWIIAEGGESNKYTMSIPLAKGLDDVIVAWAQNGEPIRPHQGFPLRLIVPGWEAIRAVKMPDVRERMNGLQLTPAGSTSEEFGRNIVTDLSRWKALAKSAGIKPAD